MAKQTTLEKQLHALTAGYFKADEPGAAVIVMRNGKPLLRAGFGLAHVELGVPIQPEMVFRLGSITKQFTAVSILMLEARGKLSVQDRITKYLPGYPVRGYKITIEHLLTHTSGIKNYTNMPEFWKDAKEDKSVTEHIDQFKKQPMDFAPGARWAYSNSGYFLLGAIIEKVSGQSYAEFLKRHIFDPLGMSHTYFDTAASIIPGRVAGYGKNADVVENTAYISMTRPYAAGSLASSVDDLAKWDAALYTETLVPHSALQRAWTPCTTKTGRTCFYGYGWGIMRYQGHTCIEHDGGINGFNTSAVRIPEKRIYAAVLANTNAAPVDPSFLAFKLAALTLGIPYEDPVAVPARRAVLARFAGRYQVKDAGFPLILTPKAGKLFVQFAEDQPQQALFALSPTEFFLKGTKLRLRIDPEGHGPAPFVQMWDRETLIDTAERV